MSIDMAKADAAAAPLPRTRRSRIPGLAAIRATAGFQRTMLVLGAALIGVFVVVAVFAPLIAPYGFNDNAADGKRFPAQAGPSGMHWFGTTDTGEDVFSQVIYGAQTALLVILLAVAISIVIGVPLGLLAGYLGGWLDRILVLLTDALFAFPSLLLAIIVSIAAAGDSPSAWDGILAAAISITVVYVPQYFRVVRNATVAAREETYVEAARAIGAAPWVVMTRYVFGNVVQTVPVIATLNAGDAILTLAGLGFLGYGIEPSAASEWGRQLSESISDVSNEIWWTSTFPGLGIVLIVLGVTLVGESLNDVLNPVLRTRKVEQVVLPEPAADEPGGPVTADADTPRKELS